MKAYCSFLSTLAVLVFVGGSTALAQQPATPAVPAPQRAANQQKPHRRARSFELQAHHAGVLEGLRQERDTYDNGDRLRIY